MYAMTWGVLDLLNPFLVLLPIVLVGMLGRG